MSRPHAVTGLARLIDPALADWIAANVAFPNGMVDRITPATGPRERALAAEPSASRTPVPVICEPFRQWVLEDNFPAGPPGASRRSASTFVADVHAYELMKIRILNGGHADDRLSRRPARTSTSSTRRWRTPTITDLLTEVENAR